VPRPIALVTTVNADGVVNAAPFSMFNMVGEDPPLVMVSINRLENDGLKNTASNILANGQFVVHLVDEGIASQMHDCALPVAADVSELQMVGFTAIPSLTVLPPCIAEAPIAFECTLHEKLETASRHVFLGRVQSLRARDGLVDVERWRVRLQEYFPVARFGASFYIRTRERFSLDGSDRESRSTSIDEM